MVIERVTRDSYGDQLAKRILLPLGLRDTCYAPYTCPAGGAHRMPTGYFFSSPGSVLQGYPVPVRPFADHHPVPLRRQLAGDLVALRVRDRHAIRPVVLIGADGNRLKAQRPPLEANPAT